LENVPLLYRDYASTEPHPVDDAMAAEPLPVHDVAPAEPLVVDDAMPVETLSVHDAMASSSIILNTAPGCDEGTVGPAGRRKKKETPQKTRRKNRRESGKEYITKKGKVVPAMCVKPACSEKCLRQCTAIFTPEDRQVFFEEFWKLDTLQRKDFVLRNVNREDEAGTTVAGSSRRQYTRQYYLPKNDSLVQVCRCFFQATLDVKDKFLRYTEVDPSLLHCAHKDKRGRRTPKNRTPPRSLEHLREFIESLPAVESHYCRNTVVHSVNICLNLQ
jgi:hypothetical protein